VKLTFVARETSSGHSPTLYATDRGTYVIQGWQVVDTEALAQMDIPAHETCVEVPRALIARTSVED
jgi:hypothetical protein